MAFDMTLSPSEKLAAARHKVRELAPYFSAALLALIPREAPGLGTFGTTDNGILLWDPAFVEVCSVKEIAAVLVHEILHVLQKHDHTRRGTRDPRLWNLAADMAINPSIVDMQLVFPKMDLAKVTACLAAKDQQGALKEMSRGDGPLLPSRFRLPDNLTAEEYFTKLSELQEELGGGGGGGEGEEGEKGKGEQPQGGGGWCGSCAGRAVPGEPEDGKGPPQEGESTGNGRAEGRSEAELERVRKQTAEAIQQQAKQQGTVPGGLARWAENVLGPVKIRWQDKLARITRRAMAYRPGAVDYKYDRPSRRQGGIGYGPGRPVLPALRAPVPRVAVVVDTSGSMGMDLLMMAVREARGILTAAGADITFAACDAEVHELRKVRDWKQMTKLLKGGGGTSFCPAFEALHQQRERPEVVVFVTDGYGDCPTNPPPGMKVVWLLVGNPRTRPTMRGGGQCTWGEFIELDE